MPRTSLLPLQAFWSLIVLGSLLSINLHVYAQSSGGWMVRPEWVRAHEEFLASDAMAGRRSGSRDEAIAAAYVGSAFLSYGLSPAPGMTGYVQTAKLAEGPLHGRIIFSAIGYLPGSNASGETVLLSAHLDHLGTGKPVRGDAIYNGADDDASGVAAVLELAHALAGGPKPRRSVLFVCYGGEEPGLVGSTYLSQHSPVPLTHVVANLEFEMIGLPDPNAPGGRLSLTGWSRSDLGPALAAHGAPLGSDAVLGQDFFARSDNYAMALKGVVAHTVTGWATPPTYHQPSDDLSHLDLAFLTATIQAFVEPVRWLVDSDFVPSWNQAGRPRP